MADVLRTNDRVANPVRITDRNGKEAAVQRVTETDGVTTTDALATYEAGTLPITNRDLGRQQVAYQRLMLIELRVLTFLLQEQITGWYDLDKLRQEIDQELGTI